MPDASRVEISYRFAGAINLANTLPAIVNTASPTIFGAVNLSTESYTGFPILHLDGGGGNVMGFVIIPPSDNNINIIISNRNSFITVPPDQVSLDNMGLSVHPSLPTLITVDPNSSVFYLKLKKDAPTDPPKTVLCDLMVF